MTSSPQDPAALSRQQFADAMVARIQRSGGRFSARYRIEPLDLELLKDGKVVTTLPIEKAYLQYVDLRPEQVNPWWIQVLNYLLDPHEEPAVLDERWPELRPAMRTRSYFDSLRIQAETDASDFEPIPFAPIGDHLAICIMRNRSNRTMQFVDEELLIEWKLEFRDAMRKARMNLDSIPANVICAEDCVFSFDDDDAVYHTGRLLCWKTLRQFPIRGDFVALAPTTDSLFITGSDDPRGIELLAVEAERYFQDPSPLCPIPVRRVGDKWKTWLPPERHAQHDKFLDIQRRFTIDQYRKQSELLIAHGRARGSNVSIGLCSLMKTGNSELERTVTEWRKGTKTLLPLVECISFLAADGSPLVLAEWDDVVEVCGDLLQRDRDRCPPRFLVEKFPTNNELRQMGPGPLTLVDQLEPDVEVRDPETVEAPATTKSAAPQGPPTRDAFAAILIERLKQIGENRPFAYDKQRFRLVAVENGGVVESLYLGKWYDGLHSTPIADRNQWWVRALHQIQQLRFVSEGAESLKIERERLRPLICRRSYFEMLKLQAISDRIDAPRIPHWPIGDDLAVCIVEDLPGRMKYIHEGMLTEAGLNAQQTLAKAIQNLEAREFDIASAADRIYLIDGDESYNASCILLTKTIRSLQLQGDPVAVAVNRNRLFVTADDPESLALLRMMMEDALHEPDQLSPRPMKLIDGKWRTWLPPAGHPQHAAFRSLEREYFFDEYDAQKERLSGYYESIDRDVFVASYMHQVRETDGFEYSAAVWIKDLPTMLPKSEYIIFMRDQSTMHMMASWDNAFRTVSQRMQLDSTCFPLRWRVESYPTAEEFQRMGARPCDLDTIETTA
ncbi:MAG: hypothetical protein AB7O26_01095 [Planctomycetaceae bacterium]